MKLIVLFIALIATLAAAERPDITLYDGTVFRQGRIAVIKGELVTIVHAGGASVVPAEAVPLDVLARGKMEIEARTFDPERLRREEKLINSAADRAGEELKRKTDLAAIDTTIEITDVFSIGVIAVPASGWTGEEQITQIVHRGTRQGTGLDSHRQVDYTWTETLRSRRNIYLEPVIWVRMNSTEGFFPKKRMQVRIWPLGSDTVGKDEKGKPVTVAIYTTTAAEFATTLLPEAPRYTIATPALAPLRRALAPEPEKKKEKISF